MILSDKELKQRFRKIKLIVSDIDGTLVNSKNEVSELTLKVVKELKNKNILFSLASQRAHSSIVPIAKLLDIKIPVISINGALIQDIKGETVLNKSVIDKKYAEKAVRLAENNYVKIALCYNDRIVYTEDNSVLKDFMTRFGTIYDKVEDYSQYTDNVLEIIMSGNDRKIMRDIQKKMTLPFGLILKVKFFRSQVFQGVYNIEILRKNINKKTGLKILTKYLKLKRDEVMVFGDWYNDRDLFQYGGTNIALDNAVDELKDMADHVSERSNDEDGIGHFLQMFSENLH
ncbi:MAG TPA: Cof-type HAD-IIB family hydrolase [Ignavibacteria bacterium]|nr:Cof-type HAD-IIB family hydrolase [Ignavibacteria bacterium]